MSANRYLDVLAAKRLKGEPLVVAGVGSGITARAARSGGADVLATYNTAAYRMKGIPTAMAFLPYDDCNSLTLSLAPEVMAAAADTPVLLGFGAHDPRRPVSWLVDQAQLQGAAGVTNEPFIGMYEGDLRNQLEASGHGFGCELALVAEAVRRGLLSLGWVFTPDEARRMIATGTQLLGVMVGGVTSGGAAGGAETISLDEAIRRVERIMTAMEGEGAGAAVLVHGGPLNDPVSVAKVLARTGAAGYVTGSTGERLPVERAVEHAVGQFKVWPGKAER